jgi:hypothetical protein
MLRKLGLSPEWAALPARFQLVDVISDDLYAVSVEAVDQ